MKRQESILLKLLTLFSGLTSFVFIYYSVGIFSADSVPEWTKVFAYVAAGYGLGNIYILSWAWRSGGTWPLWANKLIALCFFGVFVMDRWKTATGRGLEYVGVLGVAIVLWLNWFAVKKIAESRNIGEPEKATARKKPGRGK